MSYSLNWLPAHCKEKIIVIAPSPRTCSFFIPTEENMPGIQLPMAGEATDLHCLFPKSMQFLAVFHPNLSFYPQIRVSLSSQQRSFLCSIWRQTDNWSKCGGWVAAGCLPLTHTSATQILYQGPGEALEEGQEYFKSWRLRLLAARDSDAREGKMNSWSLNNMIS